MDELNMDCQDAKNLDGVPLFNENVSAKHLGYYKNVAQPLTAEDFDWAIKALEQEE